MKHIDTSINGLIYAAHKNACAKGFWEDRDTNKEKADELLALTIGEVSELLESMRKPKTIGTIKYDSVQLHDVNFMENYEIDIKGTIHEELADIFIRLCDFAGGFDLKPATIEKYIKIEMTCLNHLQIKPRSFCFYLTKSITDIKFSGFPSQMLGECIGKLYTLAKHYDIDLLEHVKLKMKYNSLRPYKHNKQF